MHEVISFIFARGGSKGLPNKNVMNFAGRPLISWTIEQATLNPRIGRVIVSTDSPEIAKISEQYGAEVPFMRPTELATDESSELLSWKHALGYLLEVEGKLPEIFLSLPCTAPLRSQTDINRNLDLLVEKCGDVVISVCPSLKSPFFNMVTIEPNGQARVLFSGNHQIKRRQDAPITFDITTVAYSSTPKFILETNDIMSGTIHASVVDKERAFDIDDAIDFEIAEYFFKKKVESK